MVTTQVILGNQDRPSLPQRFRAVPLSLAGNCLRITSLADQCTLTSLESNPYEKPRGGGHLGSHWFACLAEPFTPGLPRPSRGLRLFSTTYAMPHVQCLGLDHVATVPGGRGALLNL